MPESSDGSAAAVGAVRDDRRAPFCYQTHDALDRLRATFTGNRRATALAIYLCLTEVANRSGGAAAREGFAATRKEIAEAAGVSDDTLDRYVREMEAAGLVQRERRRIEGVNLPNVWALLEPGLVPPVAAPVRPGGSRAGAAQVLEETTTKEGETSSPFSPPRLALVDGRNLGMDAVAEECGIVDGDPRYKEVIVALNGKRGGPPGIRALFWADCERYVADHPEANRRLADLAAEPERLERALESAIRTKARRYREVMGGAFLTPGALAKWWVSVESMQGSNPGLSPDEIRRIGAQL